MIGDIKYPATFTLDELARSCTENENWSFARLTRLGTMQPAANLAHFINTGVGEALKDLAIVFRGEKPAADATLLFTARIYAGGKLADVDVYRLQ